MQASRGKMHAVISPLRFKEAESLIAQRAKVLSHHPTARQTGVYHDAGYLGGQAVSQKAATPSLALRSPNPSKNLHALPKRAAHELIKAVAPERLGKASVYVLLATPSIAHAIMERLESEPIAGIDLSLSVAELAALRQGLAGGRHEAQVAEMLASETSAFWGRSFERGASEKVQKEFRRDMRDMIALASVDFTAFLAAFPTRTAKSEPSQQFNVTELERSLLRDPTGPAAFAYRELVFRVLRHQGVSAPERGEFARRLFWLSMKQPIAFENLLGPTSSLVSMAEKAHTISENLRQSAIAPTVRFRVGSGRGSGTIVFSGKNPVTGEIETYMLTAFHVVEDGVEQSRPGVVAKKSGVSEKQRSDAAHAGVATSSSTPKIMTEIFLEGPNDKIEAEVISYDQANDLALVKLKSGKVFRNVARFIPRSELNQIQQLDEACLVGCPLGADPRPSMGNVTIPHDKDSGNVIAIDAPGIFGCSGGGVYMKDSQFLMGVYRSISAMRGRRLSLPGTKTRIRLPDTPLPHMGHAVRPHAIYEWLDREGLSWVLESTPG